MPITVEVGFGSGLLVGVDDSPHIAPKPSTPLRILVRHADGSWVADLRYAEDTFNFFMFFANGCASYTKLIPEGEAALAAALDLLTEGVDRPMDRPAQAGDLL